MVNVCAWCDRFLGIKEPATDATVTHGICKSCFARQTWDKMPVLVVTPEREHLVPVLADVLRGLPEIRVIVERRGRTPERGDGTRSDRREIERRRDEPVELG